MSKFLVLDIETIPDPDLIATADIDPEKMLSVPHHKIVCIGAAYIENYSVKKIGIIGDGKSENEQLFALVDAATDRDVCLVTFNGRGFDLPVIAMRCLRYGIQFKHYYQSRDVRYRFSVDGHFDLMDYLADYGATKSSKLDVVARVCGMPGKVGVNGKDVAGMVAAGRVQEVKDYCLCDVAQTCGVFLRTQLVRGVIDLETYKRSISNLLDVIRGDVRLKPVADAMDVKRLMVDG